MESCVNTVNVAAGFDRIGEFCALGTALIGHCIRCRVQTLAILTSVSLGEVMSFCH